MTDPAPEEPPAPPPGSPFPPPPPWLQVVIVLTSLGWGTVETFFLGARMEAYGFILAVLTLSLGVRLLGTAREMMR